jgi:protein SCO1
MSRNIAIIAAAGLGAVLAGTYAATLLRGGDPIFADCTGGQVAGGDLGGPLDLIDETGRAVTDADIFAAPTILYFGYTFCPSICPTDVQRNAFALELLEDQGIIANGAMISVDPDRDTPAVMADFTDAFHPRILGLTGSAEQVAAAMRAWRVIGERAEGGDPEFYEMNHTTFSYLVLPGHGFVSFFSQDTSPEDMAAETACFVQAAARI